MIYAISDVHGRYDKYVAMLRTINLRPDDTLYVLGDVVDRGPDPIGVLRDMAARPNVIPILGNHEFVAAYCMGFLLEEITEESIAGLDAARWAAIEDWSRNEGRPTMEGFGKLSAAERRDFLDYLGEFSLYEEVRAAGNIYLQRLQRDPRAKKNFFLSKWRTFPESGLNGRRKRTGICRRARQES